MVEKSNKSRIEERLKNVLIAMFHGDDYKNLITLPTNRQMADYVSNIAFSLAKTEKDSPINLATKIADSFNKDTNFASASAVMPGFINFKLSNSSLLNTLNTVSTEANKYGENDQLKNQVWSVEHTSPNPNKAMHIGHLRNNLVGMSVGNIVEANGAKVIRDCIDNNRGIAISKAMWGFLYFKRKDDKIIDDVHYWVNHKDEWQSPYETNEKPDHFIGGCYQLASSALKDNKEKDKLVRQMTIDWENEDPDTRELWAYVLDLVHDGINQTLEKVGNKWDKVWHEHEHYKDGRNTILNNIETGVFKKAEDSNAILTNLKDRYGINDTIAIKSDGTSVYFTQDVALTKLKKDTFKADKMFWVIGPEQSLAMKQVFATAELLGLGKLEDFIHLSYGLVAFQTKEGKKKKMSSRGGATLLIDDLIEELTDKLLKSNRNYSKEEAEKLAINAIKFALLKPARSTDITIDLDDAISIEGDSGIYILYTIARINTLLDKGKELGYTNNLSDLKNISFNENEKSLITLLDYYPEYVKNALNNYMPNVLCEYLIELAHTFNALYAKERFVSEDKNETIKKLVLASAVKQTMTNASKLLGLTPVDRI